MTTIRSTATAALSATFPCWLTDTATGQRMVMDNGHVFNATVEAGVGSYTHFARRVDRMWAGTPPDGMQFALGQ